MRAFSTKDTKQNGRIRSSMKLYHEDSGEKSYLWQPITDCRLLFSTNIIHTSSSERPLSANQKTLLFYTQGFAWWKQETPSPWGIFLQTIYNIFNYHTGNPDHLFIWLFTSKNTEKAFSFFFLGYALIRVSKCFNYKREIYPTYYV